MSNTHAYFEPICALLEQQLEQYTKLLALAEEKRDCLVNIQIENLEKLVRAESMQLKQIAALEKKRLAATAALGTALNLGEDITLLQLIPHAQGEQQAQLQGLSDSFAELVPRLNAANNINRELLQTNMQLNDLMLDMMTGPEDPLNNFYGADGSEPEEKISSPSIFDQQI